MNNEWMNEVINELIIRMNKFLSIYAFGFFFVGGCFGKVSKIYE